MGKKRVLLVAGKNTPRLPRVVLLELNMPAKVAEAYAASQALAPPDFFSLYTWEAHLQSEATTDAQDSLDFECAPPCASSNMRQCRVLRETELPLQIHLHSTKSNE